MQGSEVRRPASLGVRLPGFGDSPAMAQPAVSAAMTPSRARGPDHLQFGMMGSQHQTQYVYSSILCEIACLYMAAVLARHSIALTVVNVHEHLPPGTECSLYGQG